MTSESGSDKRPGQKRSDGKSTGAGAEAAEGMHSAKGRSQQQKSGVDETTSDSDNPGSEPLRHRKSNPKGSYGGEGGKPRG